MAAIPFETIRAKAVTIITKSPIVAHLALSLTPRAGKNYDKKAQKGYSI